MSRNFSVNSLWCERTSRVHGVVYGTIWYSTILIMVLLSDMHNSCSLVCFPLVNSHHTSWQHNILLTEWCLHIVILAQKLNILPKWSLNKIKHKIRTLTVLVFFQHIDMQLLHVQFKHWAYCPVIFNRKAVAWFSKTCS